MTKLIPFQYEHLIRFEFLPVELRLLTDPEYRVEFMHTINDSVATYSLFKNGLCLGIGGQVAGGKFWVVLSRAGLRSIKTVIKTINGQLNHAIMGVGTYVPEVPQYERFAKVFNLVKTNTPSQYVGGYTFNWWEFS